MRKRVMGHSTNSFFDSLSSADRDLLKPVLRPVELKQQQVLHGPSELITTVYFPFDAVVSLVTVLSTGETVESAMVGHDGIVGAQALIGGRVSLTKAIVQLGGDGLAGDADAVRKVVLSRPSLHHSIDRHQEALLAQSQQSAACNVTHVIESRLARWLLRASDLCGRDTLDLTQEFLAEMLGVRRTSVSLVAHTLQKAGFISYRRGRIKILDKEGLQESACECYTTVKMYYDALIKAGNE